MLNNSHNFEIIISNRFNFSPSVENSYNEINNEAGNLKNSTIDGIKRVKNDLMPKKHILNKKRNKFSNSNLMRRCKKLLLDNLINFINGKLKIIYKNNFGQGRFIKQFLSLNQEQKSTGNVKFNKNFLYKSLREIFGENISPRITNYSPEHNKNLIEFLVDEKNENNEYFKRLFNMKFSECLAHFNGTKIFKELEGMNTFAKIEKDLEEEEDKDYIVTLNYYITNFESLTNIKKERNRKKKKNNEEGN